MSLVENNEVRYPIIYTFYQYCNKINEKTGRYNVEKYIYNSQRQFVNFHKLNLNQKQLNKLLSTLTEMDYVEYDLDYSAEMPKITNPWKRRVRLDSDA
jgi:hypothetical protein